MESTLKMSFEIYLLHYDCKCSTVIVLIHVRIPLYWVIICSTFINFISNIHIDNTFYFNITEDPNPLDDTEKESTTEEAIPTVPEEEDETTAMTPDPSSKQPDRTVICSVGQATRIHCTIMKSVIPHLQRSLTKKVIALFYYDVHVMPIWGWCQWFCQRQWFRKFF